VILAASSLRTDVSEYVASNNKLPGDDWQPDFQQTKYVDKLEWADGKIVATARNIGDDAIDGETITLTPEGDGSKGVIPSWTCEGSINTKFRPGSCQGAASTTSGGGTSGG